MKIKISIFCSNSIFSLLWLCVCVCVGGGGGGGGTISCTIHNFYNIKANFSQNLCDNNLVWHYLLMWHDGSLQQDVDNHIYIFFLIGNFFRKDFLRKF